MFGSFGSFSGGNEIYTGDIGHSLRFRGAQTLTRTPASSGNQKQWTYAVCYKPGRMGHNTTFMQCYSSATNYAFLGVEAINFLGGNSTLKFYVTVANTAVVQLETNLVLRAPTAHYYIQFVLDTPNATAADRAQIWVNGVRVASFISAIYPAQNSDVGFFNTTATHTAGQLYGYYSDMYLSRKLFVDGEALTPSSFGYLNTTINEWVSKTQAEVKAVVDAGGTNSFMLDFDDGTSLTSELRSLGTNIGNGTTYGGLAAAFDGNTSQILTASACITGFNNITVTVGKDWGAGVTRTIRKMKVFASSGDGFTNSTDKSVVLKLQGSTDNFSSSVVDLYTSSFTTSAGQVVTALSGIDTSTAYRYHRLQIAETNGNAGGHAVGITEIVLSEDIGLGKDLSDKLNNWTLNNFSLTAGTTYDWMLDVPGNLYATLMRMPTTGIPLSAANLNWAEASGSSTWKSNWGPVALPTTGKWYFEAGISSRSGATNSTVFGLHDGLAATLYCGSSANSYGFAYGGQLYNNASVVRTLAGYTTNDIVRIAFDADAGNLWFGVNGAWREGDPAAGTSPSFSSLSSSIARFFGVSTYWASPDGSSAGFANFGQRPFAYTPPTDFLALCQANEPTPAILNPELHMAVVTVTKSGNTNFTIPWNADTFDTFFEIKRRNAVGDWYQIDTLRGYDKILKSNSTAAETTDANVLGILGTTGTLKSTLADGTYVISMYKAGLVSARQTNTDGSITSTVSANVEAGFSIVTWTGNGVSGETVGHGLNKVPEMQNTKMRSAVNHWIGRHVNSGYGNTLYLSQTSAAVADSGSWTATPTPTTTTFTVGNANLNQTGATYVAYNFASIPGYSKAFSYTGNGSTDGPYVDLGFKAKKTTIKSSSGATDWETYDSARDTYNQMANRLYPNSSSAETGGSGVDFVSSAQKIRIGTGTNINTTSATYIGFAIADVAGKYSLAR